MSLPHQQVTYNGSDKNVDHLVLNDGVEDDVVDITDDDEDVRDQFDEEGLTGLTKDGKQLCRFEHCHPLNAPSYVIAVNNDINKFSPSRYGNSNRAKGKK